ncbi:MAG: SH3 domain-containing protein [Bacteroidales bacterium]|nr:SH3 domain-containing protein [Bacteroidales bacterium]
MKLITNRIFKNLLLSGFICMIAATNIYATDINSLQDSAANYYNNAQYSEALVFYDSIYNLNYSSADLFLNMGNCYYQIGDIPSSIYYYELSLNLDPANENTKHNLKIVNTKIETKAEDLPVTFYKRWFTSIISVMSADAWGLLAIFLFIFGLGMLALYFFSFKLSLRKTGFILAIISIIFASCSVAFSINLAKKVSNNNYAIVFDKGLVKSSPNNESNNLFEISKGLKVEIIDSLNLWYNIKLSDGKQGWIEAENLQRL